MMYEEILGVLEQELRKRKVLMEGRGDRLEVAEQQMLALQEDNEKLRHRMCLRRYTTHVLKEIERRALGLEQDIRRS